MSEGVGVSSVVVIGGSGRAATEVDEVVSVTSLWMDCVGEVVVVLVVIVVVVVVVEVTVGGFVRGELFFLGFFSFTSGSDSSSAMSSRPSLNVSKLIS